MCVDPDRLTRKTWRILDILAGAKAWAGNPVSLSGRNKGLPGRFSSSDDLVREHFASRGNLNHINFQSFLEALRLLQERPSWIIETGSSAWGTDSSRLFDNYVASFGGTFWSVDIRLEPMLKLKKSVTGKSILTCDDSVRFLQGWVDRHPGQKVDLVYLDSWDLNVSDPLPAAIHGLKEFFAIKPALRDGALLLIDDTPADIKWLFEAQQDATSKFNAVHGMIPGKGMLIELYLRGKPDVIKVSHRYQVLYRFQASS
jgi:hypothetical protein